MNIYDPRTIAAGATAAVVGRPATSIVHDNGAGYVEGATGEWPVRQGELIVFSPGEPHAMRADEHELILSAVITPRPGSRS